MFLKTIVLLLVGRSFLNEAPLLVINHINVEHNQIVPRGTFGLYICIMQVNPQKEGGPSDFFLPEKNSRVKNLGFHIFQKVQTCLDFCDNLSHISYIIRNTTFIINKKFKLLTIYKRQRGETFAFLLFFSFGRREKVLNLKH